MMREGAVELWWCEGGHPVVSSKSTPRSYRELHRRSPSNTTLAHPPPRHATSQRLSDWGDLTRAPLPSSSLFSWCCSSSLGVFTSSSFCRLAPARPHRTPPDLLAKTLYYWNSLKTWWKSSAPSLVISALPVWVSRAPTVTAAPPLSWTLLAPTLEHEADKRNDATHTKAPTYSSAAAAIAIPSSRCPWRRHHRWRSQQQILLGPSHKH
ncbi:hypothetical protein DE146DRAFT_440559 [Phaeosphaeria sp. MPI-PUGE-AT-0046c]|nr:hypothetical protein DE146DRAFT_440559 [Phaeosphaeria sp. MPI-PUGE-AT-0046c]